MVVEVQSSFPTEAPSPKKIGCFEYHDHTSGLSFRRFITPALFGQGLQPITHKPKMTLATITARNAVWDLEKIHIAIQAATTAQVGNFVPTRKNEPARAAPLTSRAKYLVTVLSMDAPLSISDIINAPGPSESIETNRVECVRIEQLFLGYDCL
jgi:hypothetical protein